MKWIHWVDSKLCVLLLYGLMNSGLAVSGDLPSHLNSSRQNENTKKNHPVDNIHPKPKIIKADPLFAKSQSEIFALKYKDGTIPEIRLYKDTYLAYSINFYMGNSDGWTVVLHLDNITLVRSKEFPDQVEIWLGNKTNKMAMPQRIWLSELLSGKEISADFPETSQSTLGFSAKGNGNLKFRWDAKQNKLVDIKATGKLEVNGTLEQGGIKDGAVGTRK